jgi:hypothetical protein
MTPSRKFELVVEMTESANQICRAGIATRHPEYTPEEIEQAFHRILLGDALYQRVHPGRPLLDP